MRKVSILLCVFLSLASSCCASSQDQEKTYQVKESQLVALETRLERLKQINQANLIGWQNQSKKLVELELKSQLLEKKLTLQYQESKKQEDLLQSVNQSFKTYEKEQKSKLLREKRQKALWIGVSILLGGLLVAK